MVDKSKIVEERKKRREKLTKKYRAASEEALRGLGMGGGAYGPYDAYGKIREAEDEIKYINKYKWGEGLGQAFDIAARVYYNGAVANCTKDFKRAKAYALKSKDYALRAKRKYNAEGEVNASNSMDGLVMNAEDLISAIRHERAKKRLSEKKGLDTHVNTVLFIVLGLAGLFFLSPNLTGNVIGNLAVGTSNVLGIILFLVGIVGLFFSLKK